MIIKAWLDHWGSQNGKTLKYINSGPYRDMVCVNVLMKATLYHNGCYMVEIRLISRDPQSRTAGNYPQYVEISGDDFFNGVNIIDEIYEETKTGLERKVKK